MRLPPIILASASPRRSELLRKIGLPFKVVPSDAEESHSPQLTAVELSQINACRKALAVARRFPDHLVLGVDTLVTLGPTLYGKPRDRKDAARMLMELQGKTHMVVSGVCLVHLARKRQSVFADTSMVSFRPLTAEAVQAYHARVQPLDKAGAYAIQEDEGEIVASFAGSFDNVVGLPVELLREKLASFAVGR